MVPYSLRIYAPFRHERAKWDFVLLWGDSGTDRGVNETGWLCVDEQLRVEL